METRERPPPMSETSMAGPLGGVDGDRGAPTTYVRDIDDSPPPWEVLMETREHPPPMSETSMAIPLRGTIRDFGVPTTYVRDLDGRSPRRH
jgi:hypothetical protein